MEKNFYTDNFEYYLREKADSFKMYPSKRVWHSIYNNLHPAKKWPSAAVTMLLFSALIFIGYQHSGNKNIPVTASSGTIINSTAEAISAVTGPSGNSITDVNINNGQIRISDFSPRFNNSPEPAPGLNYSKPGTNIINKDNRRENTGSTVNLPQPATITSEQRNEPVTFVVVENLPVYYTNPNAEKVNPENGNTEIAVSSGDINSNQPVEVTPAEMSPDLQAELNPSETITLQPDILNNTEQADYGNNTKPVSDNKPKKRAISSEDRMWMNNYAFENLPRKNKWKAQSGWEIYVTPGVSFRTLQENGNIIPSNALASFNNTNINTGLNHKPGIALEAGASLIHQFAKKVRWKAGVQFNYTSYSVKAFDLGHPVLTMLQMKDVNSGLPYLSPEFSSTSSTIAARPVSLINSTLQLSVPLGLEMRLAGKENLQWYAGASVQGSYIMNGKANIISADRNYYVNDPSLIRKWNLNTAVESFVTYKTNAGITLKAGPQFRYQPLSTYTRLLNVSEKPYSFGLKLGVLKSF